jgi:D-3-phosphoglycerate dehydrogenase
MPNSFRVLVTARSFCNTPGAHHDYLTSNGCEVVMAARTHPLTSNELAALIPGFDGAILGLDICDSGVIERADRLRVISRYGAGVSEIDLEAASERGIAVTNAPGANALAVAELAIGLIFCLARGLPKSITSARENTWHRPLGWELTGKTLGLIGLGAVGREVATKARALGMKVIAFDPFAKLDGIEMLELDEILERSNVISLHAPLTPETNQLINHERISKMRNGAIIVNTARGGLIDETALEQALRTGKLAGAAADTLERDPPEDHPLLQLEHFFYTPHIGANTIQSVERTGLMAAKNLIAVLRGEPCEHIVNRAMLELSDNRASLELSDNRASLEEKKP